MYPAYVDYFLESGLEVSRDPTNHCQVFQQDVLKAWNFEVVKLRQGFINTFVKMIVIRKER